MSGKWKFEKKEPKRLGALIQEEFKITKQNGKADISLEDIENIVNNIENGYAEKNENVKVLVRGLNIHKMRTLKGFHNKMGDIDIEQSYDGEVNATDKFTKFSQLQIIILREGPVRNFFGK